MKKVLLASLVVSMLAGSPSCIKDETCRNKTVESEQAAIQTFATNNGITGAFHSSGIYYQVMNPGSGFTPSTSSKVFVTYTGKFMNGDQFDTGTTPAEGWVLGTLIPGWQIGLPLIQKGGTIKLIIPSSLAYGCTGRIGIPGNSILYFEITLNDVQ
ncbi:MAG: FKBP-type peptidyl-prolyl cis-trans isomerase [Chitinophagaceae bacterium]|nr:FKBP-type peptidyl-prolyl cis-trans isomerase [Chitinophagaceae bacterium]